MGKKKAKKEQVYVVHSDEAELKELEAKKKSETKSVYVVKTNEEVVNRYKGVVREFAETPGVFILVTSGQDLFPDLPERHSRPGPQGRRHPHGPEAGTGALLRADHEAGWVHALSVHGVRH